MSELHEVAAPIPGTFYHRESPQSDPYVTVGDAIKEGDTIGLIEVMKMFNPIIADASGTVAEILVENEDAVDVGDVLIRIEQG